MSPYIIYTGNNSNCNALTHGEMVSLDESRFPALELNNRRLSVKNSFCRKNGVYTRSVSLTKTVSVFNISMQVFRDFNMSMQVFKLKYVSY